MKKYIHFAKALKPQLTKEAADIIVEEYTRLRNQDLSQTDNQARVRLKIFFRMRLGGLFRLNQSLLEPWKV